MAPLIDLPWNLPRPKELRNSNTIIFELICSPYILCFYLKLNRVIKETYSLIDKESSACFRQTIKATKFINIKHSKQTCPYFTISDSKFILLISSNKNYFKASSLYETIFQIYVFQNLADPTLPNSHIFEISGNSNLVPRAFPFL
jgi:hypothetical protein